MSSLSLLGEGVVRSGKYSEELGQFKETIRNLRERVKRLEERGDRLQLALLAAAITVIGVLLAVALT